MKKILFVLILVAIVLSVGCAEADTAKERKVTGTIAAVSNPHVFNGIEVCTLVWTKEINPGSTMEDAQLTNQWLFFPIDTVSSDLEGKKIKVSYKIVNGYKPVLIQILSVTVIE